MLNIDGLRICPRDAGIILPALEAVERDVGAWIREVRAHVLQSRAAQRDCVRQFLCGTRKGDPREQGVNLTVQFR